MHYMEKVNGRAFYCLAIRLHFGGCSQQSSKKTVFRYLSFPFLPVTSFEEVRQAVAQAELHALLVSICIPDHRAKVFLLCRAKQAGDAVCFGVFLLPETG